MSNQGRAVMSLTVDQEATDESGITRHLGKFRIKRFYAPWRLKIRSSHAGLANVPL